MFRYDSFVSTCTFAPGYFFPAHSAAAFSVASRSWSPSSVKSRTMKFAVASDTLPLMLIGCR